MSFPSNLPLDLVEKLISLSLTIVGLLIGTASFVLGLYLPLNEDLTPKKRLMSYLYLEASLLAPAFAIIAVISAIVIFSSQELWLKIYLLMILLTPVVPAIVVTYILIRNRPWKGT